MRIHIRAQEQRLTLLLPTRLLFSKGLWKFALKLGRRYTDAVPELPPAAVDALCDELRRIGKNHDPWELVNIASTDGKEIRIIL